MEQHPAFGLLGREVQDRISEREGIVDSICFDLYGCVLASFAPTKLNEKGERLPALWYDIKQLKVINPIPVIKPPDYSPVEEPVKDPAKEPAKEEGVFA